MTTLILDEYAEERILAERRANGEDQFDEVWDGVYLMAPDPNLEHQRVVRRLTMILDVIAAVDLQGDVFAGCNVSDRGVGWVENYRRPDIAVFLPGTKAIFHGAHTEGGPDFAIEIVSDNDRTWDKLDFYASVQTRELLIVDRNPWQATLLRLEAGKLKEVGVSTKEGNQELVSQVIPLSFRLIWRDGNPEIEIRHLHDGRIWHAPAAGPKLS